MAKRKPKFYTAGVYGEITPETTEKLVTAWSHIVQEFKQGDSVELLISSPGGDLDAGIGIYEYLKTSNLPFTARGIGLVGSTAVLIFTAGTQRVLTEGSFIFLHEGSVEASGSVKSMKSYTEYSDAVHQWYCQQIASCSKMPLADVIKLASAESFVDAQTSLKLGLTDYVQYYEKE